MKYSNSIPARLLLRLGYLLERLTIRVVTAASSWEERRHRRISRQDYQPSTVPVTDIQPPMDTDDTLKPHEYKREK